MLRSVESANRQNQQKSGASSAASSLPGKHAAPPESKFFRLQAMHGNQGMQRLLRGGMLQRKLTINQPGDAFEQEADRVAEKVMRMPDPSATREPVATSGMGTRLQRCSCGKSAGTGTQCEDCKAKAMQLQRSAAAPAGDTTAPPIVHDVLNSPGRPLDVATRNFMEPRFGTDFSNVRVHTGDKAAESAQAMNALAYTVGDHIVFAKGQYESGERSKQKLLAHELTHVAQQGKAFMSNIRPRSLLARTPAHGPVCDRGTVPTLTCSDAQGTTRPTGFDVDRFATDSHRVTATQRTQIAAFKAAWDAAGSADDTEVHGYASCDGTGDHNLQLSCDRAEAVKTELISMGVGTPIQTLAHGETDEFGPRPVDNHKVIIKLVPRPPQTVTIPHIRGIATPSVMVPDRIPPRVDTPVSVVFGGTPNPAAPVTLSIDGAGGANGTATINGAASDAFSVAGAQVVNLRGVTQTSIGSAGGLTLVARQRGAVLASSPGFSVSSIPQNMSFTFNRLATPADCTALGVPGCKGIVVDYAWQSDSGVPADLAGASQSERVEVVLGTGIFSGGSSSTSCYISSISPQRDFHTAGVAGRTAPGFKMVRQSFMFKDDRAGASEIPMTNSGFIVTQLVDPIPGSGFLGLFQSYQITTRKFAAATSVHDPNPTCPSGTIASNPGTGSVTKTQPI